MDWLKWRLKKDRNPTCFGDHDHVGDFTVCTSWTEYLLVRAVILITLPAIAYLGIVFTNHYVYRYGVEVKNPSLLDDMRVHVVFGVYSLIIIPAIVCIMYRMFCLCNPTVVLIAHVFFCLPILPTAAFCYLKAMEFSRGNPLHTIYLNYSGHSHIGILAILLFLIQFGAGFYMFTKKRETFAPVHSGLGCVFMVVSMMTAISGYESRRYMFLTADEEGKRTVFASGTSTVILELCIVVLIIFLSVLLGMKSMKGLFAMIYPDQEAW